MNLTITLTDKKTNPLSGANLTIRYSPPTGRSWTSPEGTVDGDGRITIPLDNRFFRQIDFKAATYTVRFQNKTHIAEPANTPSLQSPRMALRVPALDLTDTPALPVGPLQRDITLEGRVLAVATGNPITKRGFSLQWTRRNGLIRTVDLPVTDGDGRFTYEGPFADVVESVALGAKLFDRASNTVYAIESSVPPEPRRGKMEFEWTVAKTEQRVTPGPDLRKGEPGLVSGHVFASETGEPQVGLVVRAFDLDFPDEQLLGETTTADDGHYAINYPAGTAAEREKDALDIVVRAYPPRGGQKMAVAESSLHQGAPIRLVVDLTTKGKVWRGAPLFDRLHTLAEEALKGAPIYSVTPQHVILFATRVRHSPRELALYVASWRLARFCGLEAAGARAAGGFFALVYGGLPVHPAALGMQAPETLAATIDKAQRANTVAKADYSEVLAAIAARRAEFIAQVQPEILAYLEAGGLDASQAGQVIEAFLAGLTGAARADALVKRIGPKPAARAEDLFEIWTAVGGNTLLATAILRETEVRIPRDLASLTAKDIAPIARKAKAVPDSIEGTTPAGRARTYAERVAQAIENRYPYAVYAARLSLSKHRRTRELGTKLRTKLESLPPKTGGEALLSVDGWDQDLVDVASLYFSSVPTRRAEVSEILIRNGIEKSPDITAMGRPAFREKFRDPMGGDGSADIVYLRAQHIVSLAEAARMRGLTERLAEDETGVPQTLPKQLFQGSVSAACPHCQSMNSPSAYLLDLARFVDRTAVSGQATSGLGLVDRRRPDLRHVALTCANSDTPMPYIDLVLEVLEDRVETWTGSHRQTTWSVEALAAEPEHVNRAAYDALNAAAFPWRAGLDRSLERAVAYLDHAGAPLHGLQEWVLGAGGAEAAAKSYLRIGDPVPYALTTQQRQVAAAFGVQNFNRLQSLATLGALADHLLLAPETLLALLSSGYVNPEGKQLVDTDGVFTNEVWNATLLGRLAQLGRLHLRIERPIEELSHVLGAIDPSAPGWMVEFAAALRLAEALGTTVGTLVATWTGPGKSADLAALMSVDATGLDRAIGLGLGSFESFAEALTLRDCIAELEAEGVSLGDLLALAEVPTEGETYAVDQAQAALDKVGAALKEIVAEDPDPEALEAAVLEAAAEALAGEWGLAPISITAALATDAKRPLHRLAAAAGLPAPSGAPPMTAEALSRLWRFAAASALFGIAPADIATARAALVEAGLPDLSALPTDATVPLPGLLAVVRLGRINGVHFAVGESIFARLARIRGVTAQSIAKALWQNGSLNPQDLRELIGPNGFDVASRAELLTGDILARAIWLIETAAHLNTSARSVWQLATVPDGDRARAILVGQVGEAKWLDAGPRLNDPLRRRQRDALLDLVMMRSRQGGGSPRFDTRADVYAHFLIDPEMEACYDTSRVKQACASFQHFVQRVLLGLEPGVSLDPIDAQQWPWRKNYRVWEANRKVFVYPENWIEAGLRDNKTALFKELESALLQDEINADTAERALLAYARGVHTVANLEMHALLEDEETGATYVFGRTRDLPHHYYMCVRQSSGLWGGWDRIDLDIQGDHLKPLIYGRKLFLAWATFETAVATDDEDYAAQLSALETDTSEREDDIRAKLQKIPDLDDKISELETLLTDTPSGNIYFDLSAQYEAVKGTLETARNALATEVETLREEVEALNLAKNKLQADYTFDKVSLALSYFHPKTGWSPIIQSATPVRTQRERDGWEMLALTLLGIPVDETDYVHDVERVFLNVVQGGDTFSVYVAHGLLDEDSHERRRVNFGVFDFDVVTESIRTRQFAEPRFGDVTSILRGGRTYRNAVDLVDDETTLTVWDRGPVTLLDNLPEPDRLRVVPSAYEDGASMLIDLPRRSFLAEKLGAVGVEGHVAPLRDVGVQSKTDALADPKHDLQAVPSARSSEELEAIAVLTANVPQGVPDVQLPSADKWRFVEMYHPFASVAVTEIYRFGISGIYAPDFGSGDEPAQQLNRQSAIRRYFEDAFAPTPSVADDYPVDRFGFDRTRPFAIYNWELFFHAPYAIAEKLNRNRRFEDAQSWLHHIFNPTAKDGPTNASVWRFGPFQKEHERILQGDSPDILDEAQDADFESDVAEWEANPFNPHAVARTRKVAYMRATFMAYVGNLLDWGDDLFTRDTMESIAEATQLYVFAAELLGPKPVVLPVEEDPDATQSIATAMSWVPPFHQLAGLVGQLPPHPDAKDTAAAFFELFGDFCLPPNDKLLGLWDRLADRLFKIRNCMNIEGVVRALPLYQPPIDPALLVRAAAAGVSIGDAVAGLNAPRPHYRFAYMIQKAVEFTRDVSAFGGALLAALEKHDTEELARLRSGHELATAERMADILQSRITEARTAFESVTAALTGAASRQTHYETLIAMGVIGTEDDQQKKLAGAHKAQVDSQVLRAISSGMAAIPQLGLSGPFPTMENGGINLHAVFGALADASQIGSTQMNFEASRSARSAAWIRREQDWMLQRDQARYDVDRLVKDQIAAEIRLAIAENEFSNHEARIAEAEGADLFFRDKFTSAELYGWMVGELSALHYQAYKLAHDMAKQAEACMHYELGNTGTSYISFGHWDSMRKGLLSGERLLLDLRRLDAGYMAENRRSLELTKSISLARLNPGALLDLRNNGSCSFAVPEFLFDLDHPGHLNRRIKSVSLTIPAIAGPQTTIGITLTLDGSYVRVSEDAQSGLEERPIVQSIATSSGLNDSGLFSLDFRDERYLPFEGAGAISSWQLRLPAPGIAQFDYAGIADVVLNISYTAEAGSEQHRGDTESRLMGALSELETVFQSEPVTFAALLSLRFDFPEVWSRIQNDAESTEVQLELSQDMFPYLFAPRDIGVQKVTLVQKAQGGEEWRDEQVTVETAVPGTVAILVSDELRDRAAGQVSDVSLLVEFTA